MNLLLLARLHVTVVKPGHTGIHRDDTVLEPGTRPGLHRENTVTVRTRSILIGKVPRFITVYRLVFTGANRDRSGTVRTGLYTYMYFHDLLVFDTATWIMDTKSFYFILSSEINVYQKWIKVIFSLQN